jgi:hypothetical protein
MRPSRATQERQQEGEEEGGEQIESVSVEKSFEPEQLS